MIEKLYVVQYAKPELIPANLKKVALVLDNAGNHPRDSRWANVTVLVPGQARPADGLVVGGVLYAVGDVIPVDMQQVVGFGSSGEELLNDGFIGTALGSWWTVTDTGGNISVSGGNAVFAGGGGSWQDPMLVSVPSWARIAGLTLDWEVTPSVANKDIILGFHTQAPVDYTYLIGFYLHSSGIIWACDTASGVTKVASYSGGTSLRLRAVLKIAGVLLYVSTDNGQTWSVVQESSTGTAALLRAGIMSANTALTAAQARVYLGTPKPPAYSGTPTAPTPAYGAELATGTLTVGTWYVIKATEANHFFTSCAIDNTFRAAAATALDANNKVKAITLSSTLTLAADPGTKNGICDCAPTLTAGTQAGIACCLDSESVPTYMILGYHDGVNAHLDKLENGTWTSLISAAAAYSAGATLRIVKVGNSVALYYNGSAVGTTQTVDTASYGTKVATFSTLAANAPGAVAVNTGVNV